MAQPFSSGAQYLDWKSQNCRAGCAKYTGEPTCAIEIALGVALFANGRVSEKIARRMGLPGNEGALTWDCPEKVAK